MRIRRKETLNKLERRLKIVFMGVPQLGGNYTHFSYLSEGLPQFDWTLLQVGKINQTLLEDRRFVQIGNKLEREKHQKQLAKQLVEYLAENQIDILIPMNSPIAISAIPLLPTDIEIIQIVNSNTERVYKYVSEYSEYVSRIICISKRQLDDLEKKIELKNKLKLIPHGVSVDLQSNNFNSTKDFKIGYLGRIHHEQKGVFLLPEILKKIKGNYQLEIVGDGPDSAELIERLTQENINFKNYGFQSGIEKDEIIKKWNVQLFPSFVEGFGLTLIECMKFGVIPIANKINGVTDYIISEGLDGFLVEKNDPKKYQEKINILLENNDLEKFISKNAYQKVYTQFNLEKTLNEYGGVLMNAISYDKPSPKSFDKWKVYKEKKPNIINRFYKYFNKP